MAAKRKADRELGNTDQSKWTRRGIFQGMTRLQSRHALLAARESAEKTVREMIEKNIVELPEENSDAARFEEAMVCTLTVMRSPANQKERLAAARLGMEWSKAKPEAKKKVTVETAEDFLAAALADA